MTRFSILLIENSISVAAAISQVICEHVASYKLAIVNDIAEAIAAPEPAHLILLGASQLAGQNAGHLDSLAAVYPRVPIILLVEAAADGPAQEMLLEALETAVEDYVLLSKAGLTALGRRIAHRQHLWQAQTRELSTGDILASVLAEGEPQLALQLIDSTNRIRVWNREAEHLFGVPQAQAVGALIDDLPMAATNLSRLKDILDQARITGDSFCIPTYPLEVRPGQTQWGQVHVYPILKNPSAPPQEQAVDVCLISANITEVRQNELENRRYNQELQTLLEISREISEHLNLESTLEKIAGQTKSLLNAEGCHIYFLERDNQTLRAALSIGLASDQTPKHPLRVGQGVLGRAAAAGKAVRISSPNGELDPPFSDQGHLMAAPLTARGGVIGLVVINRHRSPPFTPDDQHFFENLVQLASSAISNARLFEETQRNLNELAIFYEASAAISTIWDTGELLATLIRQMVQGMDVSHGHIISWNKTRQQGTVQAVFVADPSASSQNRIRPGQTVNLAARPALSTVTNQQRPVFFQLSNSWLDESERKDMETCGCFSRLLVPLVVKGETIGWAELWETRRERIFTADEIRLAKMLANQTAVTLENARYLKQTQQTLEETTALYQVASGLATTQDPQTIMTIVLTEYLRVLSLKQGSIVIFDFEAKTGVVRVNFRDARATTETSEDAGNHRGAEGQQIPLINNPIFERLMRTHHPVIVEDTSVGWLTPRGGHAAAGIGGGWAGKDARSLLVIPIQMRGEITGAIVAEATRGPRRFEQWEISLGQAMADQLGIALQNVELYELEYQRRQQAETLREVSFIVGSSLNLNEVLERILDQLGRVIKYDSAAIHLIEGKNRRIIAGRGFPYPQEIIGMTFPITPDTNEPGSVAIQTRQPLVIGNISDLYKAFKEKPHSHIKSWMGIPLIARDKVIGLISIDRTEPNAYNEADVNLALAFANQVAITLENARLYEIEVRELERELEIAQGIQKTLLPRVVPKVPGLEICGRILPARQIGGDFFHFFFLGQDQFGVAVGDVSGKGIPAALYMAAAMTAIDAQINDNLGPGELLNKLQRILYNRLQENRMNVGLQVATFTVPPPEQKKVHHKASGRLMTLASAGMIAPIIATRAGCRFVPVSGLPIGSPVAELVYNESKVPLEPDTTIIFTSDGIVEARNEAGELFGFDRLEATINHIVKMGQADVIAEHIIEAARKFTGQAEQNDDMTVVVVIAKS